jgi:hypothetical protein
MTPLSEWANFYLIAGPSAGALIGLQFVVVTLLANVPIAKVDAVASGTFSTPSVVHFGMVLFLSAIVCAPWSDLTPCAVLWGLLGLLGLVYSVGVARKLRSQSVYEPVFEDWIFHALLPIAAYAVLGGSACLAHAYVHVALFMVAAVALLLLFIGIHNAWDAVTYHTFTQKQERQESGPNSKSKGP